MRRCKKFEACTPAEKFVIEVPIEIISYEGEFITVSLIRFSPYDIEGQLPEKNKKVVPRKCCRIYRGYYAYFWTKTPSARRFWTSPVQK